MRFSGSSESAVSNTDLCFVEPAHLEQRLAKHDVAAHVTRLLRQVFLADEDGLFEITRLCDTRSRGERSTVADSRRIFFEARRFGRNWPLNALEADTRRRAEARDRTNADNTYRGRTESIRSHILT